MQKMGAELVVQYMAVTTFYLRLCFPSSYFQSKAKLIACWVINVGENDTKTLIWVSKKVPA